MSASKKTRRRPALWTALGFGVGIFLGRAGEMGLVVAAVLSGLALAGAAAGFYRKARWTGWMLWGVVVLLGALRYHIDTALSPFASLGRARGPLASAAWSPGASSKSRSAATSECALS